MVGAASGSFLLQADRTGNVYRFDILGAAEAQRNTKRRCNYET